MARLWSPPKARPKDVENSAQFAAAIRSATFEDHICRKWNRELERLDPLLRLVKNRSDDQWIVGTPLVPGAYHLLKIADHGGPLTVIPIVDENGRALPEPPGRILEDLKGMDLQNTQVTDMRRRIKAEEARREERRADLVREQRQDQMLEHWKAVSQASVSMNRDVPWHQNAAGKRGTKKAKVS